MATRFKFSADGTVHNATPEDWKASKGLVIAGSPHDGMPTGTLQLRLGKEFSRKVCVRTNDNGDLLLEFD
jgi:hypothetical protein